MAAKKIKKKTDPQRRLPRTRYLVALGTLTAYSAAGTGKVALAQEKTQPHKNTAVQIQTLPKRRYEIPAAPIEVILSTFTTVSALNVSVQDPAILSVASPGVSGIYTPEEALSKLLENTGLRFRPIGPHAVILEIAPAVTSVNVTAEASILASALPKYQQALNDIPQTIDIVPQEVMSQQGTTTLRDALRNVAGISLAAGEGGAQGDNLTIRGFTARNDLFIDGMRDFGSYYRDPFNTHEVEVLQGPSSVTFGRGSTGGVVNQASKTPALDRMLSADLQFGTDATRRGTVDLNLPVPALGSGAAFRLNAMGNIGGVAGRDIAENRRDGFAPSLSLGLGTPTRLTLSYFHQNEDDTPDYGLPWLFNGPAPVPGNNYYGLKDGNYLRTYDDIGTAKVEHDIGGKITVRNQFRYANYARDVLITEAQLSGVKPSTPLESMTATRHEIAVNSTESFLNDQLDLTAHFNTGSLRHTLVSGVEAGRETSDPTRPSYTAPATSLLEPNPDQELNPLAGIASKVNDKAAIAGLYALDSVEIGRKWQFSGGVRFDSFDDTYRQTVPPASYFHRIDQKAAWRAAAVYKPTAIGSIYFDAGTSFNPSAETLALSAGTANLSPESNYTYEFGTKWDLRKGRLTLNSSWFRTTKQNAREVSPINSLLYVLAGTQRVTGTEVDVRGHIMSRWDVLASYAYLDSRVVGSQFYPGAVGHQLANVPANTLSYWNDYRLPGHFQLGLGANYLSSRTASSTVPLDPVTGLVKQVPGYWVFNAMAGHPLGEHMDIQVNLYNLADRYYYDGIHPAHIIPGAGRAALIDFKFKFYFKEEFVILAIPDVLTGEQIAHARQVLEQADWLDGRVTAGHQSARAKDNMQIPEGHPAAQQLGELILGALGQNALFISAALPARVFPPLFNRYQGGQSFGTHVDNAIRQVPGTGARIRTDLSATLFFAHPDEYEGGELVVEGTCGTHSVKLPAGHMILYPATTLHHVRPVTRGARVSSFFWIQSMIRDDGQRTLLFDLDMAIQRLNRDAADHPSAVQFTGVYHNLLRQWAEL